MFRIMPQDTTVLGRPPARSCEVCGGPTRERKPYCTEHIMAHGYPKALAAVIQSVQTEISEVERLGPRAAKLNGLVIEEILAGIASNGSLTWRRLLKDHVAFLNNAPESVCNAYLTKLRASGLIDVKFTGRGLEVVSLSAKGFSHLKRKHS